MQKLNRVRQCPGSAPADRFMRTGIDGDNISKTPLQEAAGGCWCDGKGYEIHWKGGTWGSVGEQHGASQLDGVWIKPLVGLKRFQRLHVLPMSVQLSSGLPRKIKNLQGSFWSLSLRQTTSQMDGWMDG